jgi:glycosyltransferase involved in cell wall biosynthesis
VTQKRTFLCIVIGTEGYGTRQVWVDLASGLRSRGWQILVAVLEANHAVEWRYLLPGVTVVAAETANTSVAIASSPWGKVLSLVRRFLSQSGHVGWLTQLARANGAMAILVQNPPETAIAGFVARRLRVPAFWFVPNAIGSSAPFDLNRRIYRTLFRLCNVIPISNSHYTDSTFGAGDFERHVVHLGVDTDFFRPGADPGPIRRRFRIPTDGPVIGLFGRMDPSKGQLRLVEALALSGTPYHVLLCGGPTDGPYADALRGTIARHGLANRVHFAGPQDDLRPYYAACDLMTNLLDQAEGFGLTVVEAMACGKPVIAHRLGGPSETIVDGITGWLLDDVRVDTIVAGLKDALASRDAWPGMGLRGRVRVETHFEKTTFIGAVDALLRRKTQPPGFSRFENGA